MNGLDAGTHRPRLAKGNQVARLLRVGSDVLTIDQVAARLGVTPEQAQKRIGRERRANRALTWRGLE